MSLTATTPSIDPVAFAYLRDLVETHSALVLDDGKEYLAVNRLSPVMRRHEVASVNDLIERLRCTRSPEFTAEVVEAMTTNETSFFRDHHIFDALRDHVLPDLLSDQAHQLRIWCAACSSGQEPYSVAMVLAEHFEDLLGRTNLLATDLCSEMVQRTSDGVFSQIEVNRGLPASMLVRHFSTDGANWTVTPKLGGLVKSRRLNLLDDFGPVGTRDLVFLRNVLIYMAPEVKSQILRRIRTEVLRPGGYLFLGSSETTLHLDDGFERVEFGKTICYRRPK